MSLLNQTQVRTLVSMCVRYHRGFPAGTNATNWQEVTMDDLEWDDPPMPGADQDFEKRKFAELLLLDFNKLGLTVPSVLPILKDKEQTLRDLWRFCFEKQSKVAVW